jgi:peptidoglycan/xylan/chitin deacetylase (PgdA/CDA1 family)
LSASKIYGSAWESLTRELDCWKARDIISTFWVRDDDACDVSDPLRRLCTLAERHGVNVGLALIPGKLEQSLIKFLENRRAQFYPMCHGWKHVDYGRRGRPAEFGSERPASALYDDGRRAFETFAEHFGGVAAVFVPPFNRIADAMVSALPTIGFVGVSKGPRALERRLSRIVSHIGWAPSARLPARGSVPHFDVQIDLIDWRRRTARDAAAVASDLVGHLRLRRSGFVSPEVPIGLLTHHLVHDDAIWALCDDLFSVLREHESSAFADVAHIIGLQAH